MRHGKKFNKLSRTHAHRRQMLANMASSLILHKRIQTTLAKAKSLRIYVEPLLTKSKEDTTHSRRVVFSYLQDKDAVTELFRDIAAKIAQRPGGYTRILKTGYRLGDNAEMAMIELVDFNENMLTVKDTKVKTRRGRKKAEPKEGVAEEATTTESEAAPKKSAPRAKKVEAISDAVLEESPESPVAETKE